jgi:wyosine [tRNA(Phe)-imidazoG37] synthetase (radical SAM superfamily)
MTLLDMHKGILYGPVNSRRYGRSLGINLMPARDKLCSFNCVYCHYGLTARLTTDISRYNVELPAFDDVVEAVEQAMKSDLSFEQVTFSGNGEPTLYPRFGDLVDKVVELRDQHRPGVRVALLSNSTGLMLDGVTRALPKIDVAVLKLDAGTERTFKAINRPAKGVEFETIIERLAGLRGFCLQTVLIDGTPSNTSEDELAAYFARLKLIRPKEVHLYSIDRPVPHERIALVPPGRLREIAGRATAETGVVVKAFHR